MEYRVVGREQLTVGASVETLTVPAGARRAIITNVGDEVRWTADGSTDPTASVGHLVPEGVYDFFMWADFAAVLRAIKFIRVTTDSVLDIEYFA